MKYALEVSYKGTRSYLHSTDIFRAIEGVVQKNIESAAWVRSLQLRSLLSSQCSLIIGSDLNQVSPEKAGQCTLQLSDSVVSGVIVSNDRQIKSRIDFAEERIEASGVVLEKKILQACSAGFTPIEEIVILTKKLHNAVFPLEIGKWIFSGIELDRPLSAMGSTGFDISLVSNLAGRLTVSEIYRSGQFLGKIKFIVWEQ